MLLNIMTAAYTAYSEVDTMATSREQALALAATIKAAQRQHALEIQEAKRKQSAVNKAEAAQRKAEAEALFWKNESLRLNYYKNEDFSEYNKQRALNAERGDNSWVDLARFAMPDVTSEQWATTTQAEKETMAWPVYWDGATTTRVDSRPAEKCAA